MIGIFDPVGHPLGWFDDWLTGDPGEFDQDQSQVTATADVTVALTGVSGAGAVGTLGVTLDVPLTTVTGAGAVGQVTASSSGADVTVALTGVSAAGVTGTLGVTLDKALTGVTGPALPGTLTPAFDVALPGRNTGVSELGNLGLTLSVPLGGVGASATAGRLTPSGGDVTTVTDTPAYSGGDTATFGSNAPGTIILGDSGG